MTSHDDPALLHLTRDVLVHAHAGRWSQAANDLHMLALHRGSSAAVTRALCEQAARDPERLVRRALRLPRPAPVVSAVHAECAAARLLFRTFDPRAVA